MNGPLLTLLGTAFTQWWDRWSRIKEARTQARIELAQEVVSNAGWKDEYIVVIWSIPAIMTFIPGLAPYAQQGFQTLKQAPEWYLIGWVSISMAVFGIKPAVKGLKRWKKGRDET